MLSYTIYVWDRIKSFITARYKDSPESIGWQTTTLNQGVMNNYADKKSVYGSDDKHYAIKTLLQDKTNHQQSWYC